MQSRGNVLQPFHLKRFRQCNDEIKFKLSESFCSSFYCFKLWSRFIYNGGFRNVVNVDKTIISNLMVLNAVKFLKRFSIWF